MKTKSKSKLDPASGKKTSLLILLKAAGVQIQKIQNPVHAHLCSVQPAESSRFSFGNTVLQPARPTGPPISVIPTIETRFF